MVPGTRVEATESAAQPTLKMPKTYLIKKGLQYDHKYVKHTGCSFKTARATPINNLVQRDRESNRKKRGFY